MNVFQAFNLFFFLVDGSRVWTELKLNWFFFCCPCFLWILHQMFPKMKIKNKRKARNYYFTRRKKYLSIFPLPHLKKKATCDANAAAMSFYLLCLFHYHVPLGISLHDHCSFGICTCRLNSFSIKSRATTGTSVFY